MKIKDNSNKAYSRILFLGLLFIVIVVLNGSFKVIEAQPLSAKIQSQNQENWNFIFVLADDMGWNQTSYVGSEFYETPNIDNIASEGIHFTNAYAAAPICSPSRAAILTGKYPARLHITEYLPGDPYPWAKLRAPKMAERLSLEEFTIAEMLKEKGYTNAMFGKWHLNKDKNYKLGRQGDPKSQGFDEVYTTVKPEYDANPYEDPHHTIKLTNLSLEFIEQNKNKPFFIYLSYHTVHRPIMEHPELIYKYETKPGADNQKNNAIMAAMIERMDQQIGRILDKLDDLDLADNTMVIFTSDNGGLKDLQTQDPLRGGKSMVFEGGNRVPLAIRMPGVIEPGSQSTTPVMGIDFFPTFADIIGTETMSNNIDGESLMPLLQETGNLKRNAIYWHYPHYHRFSYAPSGAILKGEYKLIEWYDRSFFNEEQPVSLFNIYSDIGEEYNMADRKPDKVDELWDELIEWKKNVGAQEMSKNPNFDPSKALFWKVDLDTTSAEALGRYH